MVIGRAVQVELAPSVGRRRGFIGGSIRRGDGQAGRPGSAMRSASAAVGSGRGGGGDIDQEESAVTVGCWARTGSQSRLAAPIG
jgi:hypothetical protein